MLLLLVQPTINGMNAFRVMGLKEPADAEEKQLNEARGASKDIARDKIWFSF